MKNENMVCEEQIDYAEAYYEAQKTINEMSKIIKEQKLVIRSLSALYSNDMASFS